MVAENSGLHQMNKLNFKIYSKMKQLSFNISQYYCFYCIFDEINAALVSRSNAFHYRNKLHLKIYSNREELF